MTTPATAWIDSPLTASRYTIVPALRLLHRVDDVAQQLDSTAGRLRSRAVSLLGRRLLGPDEL